MTSLNLATLRERGEQFSEALARESYLAGAGLKEATDFAGLFARYPDLSSSEAVAAAQGRRALLEWAVDNRVGRATAALEDRLHAFEQAAVVRLPDGETIPFQRVAVLIANEPRRERRRFTRASPEILLRERADPARAPPFRARTPEPYGLSAPRVRQA